MGLQRVRHDRVHAHTGRIRMFITAKDWTQQKYLLVHKWSIQHAPAFPSVKTHLSIGLFLSHIPAQTTASRLHMQNTSTPALLDPASYRTLHLFRENYFDPTRIISTQDLLVSRLMVLKIFGLRTLLYIF